MARESVLSSGGEPATALVETPHSSTGAGTPADVVIEMAPVEEADDPTVVSALTDIVNDAFTQMEGELFQEGYQRTNKAEIAQYIRQGHLAIAYVNSPPSNSKASPNTSPARRQPIGCVRATSLTPTLGNFTMLALSPSHHGAGLGRQLVLFAEQHCAAMGCSRMQLELLIPVGEGFQHAGKERMQAWYARLGYKLVKLGNFREEYPDIARMLRLEAEYRVCEKEL